MRREWGCDPLYVREGGTMPVAGVLERLLGAPAIMVPMGQSSDAPHLANERIRRLNLIKGKAVVRALLEEVAGLRPQQQQQQESAAVPNADGGVVSKLSGAAGTCEAGVGGSVRAVDVISVDVGTVDTVGLEGVLPCGGGTTAVSMCGAVRDNGL